ncbi:hypothetical protein KCP78_05635 [Salmonella enterica subsp. enterica]|nr:hypothetical protein KCP78_05635 [Salmonella enterica subsp. enterica]
MITPSEATTLKPLGSCFSPGSELAGGHQKPFPGRIPGARTAGGEGSTLSRSSVRYESTLPARFHSDPRCHPLIKALLPCAPSPSRQKSAGSTMMPSSSFAQRHHGGRCANTRLAQRRNNGHQFCVIFPATVINRKSPQRVTFRPSWRC